MRERVWSGVVRKGARSGVGDVGGGSWVWSGVSGVREGGVVEKVREGGEGNWAGGEIGVELCVCVMKWSKVKVALRFRHTSIEIDAICFTTLVIQQLHRSTASSQGKLAQLKKSSLRVKMRQHTTIIRYK